MALPRGNVSRQQCEPPQERGAATCTCPTTGSRALVCQERWALVSLQLALRAARAEAQMLRNNK